MSLNCAVFDMESRAWPETVEAQGKGAVKDEESDPEEQENDDNEVLLAHHHLWFVMI